MSKRPICPLHFLIALIVFVLVMEAPASAHSPGIATEPKTNISTGLVAYYSFDSGTANDDSGNGNNGTIHGNPQTVTGVKGQAFQFGDYYSPDYIVVPNSGLLSFLDNFTFSLWFNILSNTSQDGNGNVSQYGGQTFIGKSGDRTGIFLYAYRSTQDGLWYPLVFNGGCDLTGRDCGTGGVSIKTQPGLGVKLNEWHMMSAIHSDGRIRLYLDGILQEEMTAKEFNLDPAMVGRPLYIGEELGGTLERGMWYPLTGMLDEIRIYDRALSGIEIQSLYQQDATSYSISGRVKNDTGSPITSVSISSDAGITTTTNASGGYRIIGLLPGTYTITPILNNSAFTPVNRTVILPPNLGDQDFVLESTIAGQVRDTNNNPLAGVTVFAGPSGSAITDANGDYVIHLPTSLSAGTYKLTASKTGYSFPSQRAVTIPPNVTGQNFIGTSGITDTISPSGTIQNPATGETFTPTGIDFSATAEDNQGGSGVARVDFYVHYNGKWRLVGRSTTTPYQIHWLPPDGLQTQEIGFTIYVYDKVGNVTYDPGGQRQAQFLRTNQEAWIANRSYLNQRALGANGWEMCSMSSIAMILASLGQIDNDFDSMQEAANLAWEKGLTAPSLKQVANYLNKSSYGVQATVISSDDKETQWSTVTQEVDAGRPIILNSPPNGGNLTSYGHYIVVVGYASAMDSSQRQIIVYDPFGRWQGTVNKYDRNGASPEPPTGIKGRWNYYSFGALGVVHTITVQRQLDVAAAETQTSAPDQIFVLDSKEIVTYVGHEQNSDPVELYLPIVAR